MAVIKVKLVGSGRPNDPYRAPLPTYTEILTDYDAGTALVSIPDDDLHDKPDTLDANGHKTSVGHHILTLDEDGHRAWHKHLDDRYQEHRGEFRPEVV